MRVVLLGAPGSGKGTQAVRLARHLGVRHLSTGDLFRTEVAAGTPLGAELAGYLASGDLVPDPVVMQLVWPSIVAAAESGGYVLDGFPRTLAQATAAYLQARADDVTAHAAVLLDGEPAVLTARLLARAGEQGRPDDVASVIRHRLEVFERDTRPVVDFYADRGILARVDAVQPVDVVFAALVDALEPLRPPAG